MYTAEVVRMMTIDEVGDADWRNTLFGLKSERQIQRPKEKR